MQIFGRMTSNPEISNRIASAFGGEGMVVKPLQFVTKSRRGFVQPAVKCRGREYLRIIYRPEYMSPEHLERL